MLTILLLFLAISPQFGDCEEKRVPIWLRGTASSKVPKVVNLPNKPGNEQKKPLSRMAGPVVKGFDAHLKRMGKILGEDKQKADTGTPQRRTPPNTTGIQRPSTAQKSPPEKSGMPPNSAVPKVNQKPIKPNPTGTSTAVRNSGAQTRPAQPPTLARSRPKPDLKPELKQRSRMPLNDSTNIRRKEQEKVAPSQSSPKIVRPSAIGRMPLREAVKKQAQNRAGMVERTNLAMSRIVPKSRAVQGNAVKEMPIKSGKDKENSVPMFGMARAKKSEKTVKAENIDDLAMFAEENPLKKSLESISESTLEGLDSIKSIFVPKEVMENAEELIPVIQGHGQEIEEGKDQIVENGDRMMGQIVGQKAEADVELVGHETGHQEEPNPSSTFEKKSVNIFTKLPSGFLSKLSDGNAMEKQEALNTLKAHLEEGAKQGLQLDEHLKGEYEKLVSSLAKLMPNGTAIGLSACQCLTSLTDGLPGVFSEFLPKILPPLLIKMNAPSKNINLLETNQKALEAILRATVGSFYSPFHSYFPFNHY